MSYARASDPSISLNAGSIASIFAAMTFSPWVAFAVAPTALAGLWFFWLPVSLGAILALIMTRGSQPHYRLFLAFVAPLFLLIPTNIVGHMLAHLLFNGCYD